MLPENFRKSIFLVPAVHRWDYMTKTVSISVTNLWSISWHPFPHTCHNTPCTYTIVLYILHRRRYVSHSVKHSFVLYYYHYMSKPLGVQSHMHVTVQSILARISTVCIQCLCTASSLLFGQKSRWNLRELFTPRL